MNHALEMWGGVECTVCRAGDDYIDQMELTGHAHRLGDIDLIASLGIRTVRYPVLWERVAPSGLESADWRWPDERLDRLRQLGVTPVVGLLHHGSGPIDTSFADADFAARFAAYAGACARRYEWMQFVTPVNEPLTTARFAGLYGHWYPHARDDASFARLLINECQGIRAAMSAMRQFLPDLRLLQTEDLGHTHACDGLEYQADFENERRWLTWDLLCGRVSREHPMYDYLRRSGIGARVLGEFVDRPCPPDIIGIDHYVTSERYLDADTDAYPVSFYGGNGHDSYADVEVVRARPELRRGVGSLMREAWDRYGIPLIVAEAHLSCDEEEERVRWLVEIWNAARSARAAGCDVRAVTAWALFGASGWDALSTRRDGRYEAGAFDVGRTGREEPRETAVGRAIRSLATEGCCSAEFLDTPGWWQHSPAAVAGAV